jgi:hypothetical protein
MSYLVPWAVGRLMNIQLTLDYQTILRNEPRPVHFVAIRAASATVRSLAASQFTGEAKNLLDETSRKVP